jgi:hypothetical protein
MSVFSKDKSSGEAASRYKKIETDSRTQFLNRARHNAVLTIPSLMPLEGYDGKSHLIEPYQGTGAAGTVHLSSRLTMALLPAGRPHMRFDLPPEVVLEFGEEGIPKDLEVGLAQSEKLVQMEVEDKGWRPSTLMAIQQQIIAGNHLEHQLEDNTIRIFRLDQYVVRRDWAGHPLEMILEEKLTPDTLPEGMPAPEGMDQHEEILLYTWIRRDGSIYEVYQELGSGQKVSDVVKYDLKTLPYNAVRWSKTPGEDYGRSFVEEHIADIRSLDALTKAELEMAAMASRNFITVRPGSVGAGIKRRLTQAVNGDVMMIDPAAIELKSFDNVGGFQLVNLKSQQLTQELSRAFLLHSAGQRDAERVTATEIERDIQELEAALGGNFSTLNTDMMERRTTLLMRNMERDGRLPEGLLENGVRPTVLTGLEALSRERDVSRVQQLAGIVAAFGETAVDNLRLNKVLARATVGLGFADVVRTDDEVQGIQQQRQQEQMAQQMAGPMIQAASKEQEEAQ